MVLPSRKVATYALAALAFLAVLSAGIFVFYRNQGKADNIDLLTLENLGPMSAKGVVELGPLAPTKDGTGLVQVVFKYYGTKSADVSQPFDIVTINLQTGETTAVASSTSNVRPPRQVQITKWGPDGKLYMGTYYPAHLISWDPKTNIAKDYGETWPNGLAESGYSDAIFRLTVGTDGAIYGGDMGNTNVMRFDPKTEKLDGYPPQGPARSYYPAYAYSVASDENYIYTAAGKQPWYIVAMDKRTGEQKTLFTFKNLDYPVVYQQKNTVYLAVAIAAADGKPASNVYYELKDGKATPLSSKPSIIGVSFDPPAPGGKPEVILDASSGQDTGTARIWYRLAADKKKAPSPAPAGATPESQGWHSATIKVAFKDFALHVLTSLSDGRIIGDSYPYGDFFTYNPTDGTKKNLGPSPTVSVYSLLTQGSKVYISGYPNTPLLEYDTTQPWTFQNPTPLQPLLADNDPANNPQTVHRYGPDIQTHYGRSLTADYRGIIYVGSHAERERVGGGLSTYNPTTGEYSSISQPLLTNYDIRGLTTTADKKLVVFSSMVVSDPATPNSTPKDAKLFVYDAVTQKMLREITPITGDKSVGDTGKVAVGIGNQIVGGADTPTGSRIYAVDAKTGAKIYSHDIEGQIGASFVNGPDNKIWTILATQVPNPKDATKKLNHYTIITIDPATGAVTQKGRIPFVRTVFAFSGRDMYLTNGNNLMRIKDIADQPMPSPGPVTTPTPTPLVTPTPTPTPTPRPTPTPTPTPKPTPTPTPTPTPVSSLCLKIQLPDIKSGAAAFTSVSLTARKSNQVTATVSTKAASNGLVTISDTTMINALNSTTTSNLTVKTNGFLSEVIASPAGKLSCATPPTVSISRIGDISNNDKLDLSDIISLIHARREGTSATDATVKSLYQRTPTLGDIINLIRTYNEGR